MLTRFRPTCRSRPASFGIAILAVAICGSLAAGLTGCGLITDNDEYLALVDSVRVAAPPTPAAAVPVRIFGYVGSNGCAELVRTERVIRGDTIVWRFTARSRGGTCTQMPIPLLFRDSVPNLPARTVYLRVEHRGAPVLQTVRLPLGAAP
jgi:hypothetical protein